MDTLLPIGSGTVTFPTRTPSQSNANTWLNVANGLISPDQASFVGATVQNQEMPLYFGPVTFTGDFGTIRFAFMYSGEADTSFPSGPACEFTWYLDGIQASVTKRFDLDTEDSITTGIAVWTTSDFLTTMTAAIWNSKTLREMRPVSKITSKNDDGRPSPYVPVHT